jgi:HK97 family phage prohead protease
METTPFTLQGKSLEATELQSGDIRLDGYCVVFEGLDSDGESFLRGALSSAAPEFLNGPAPLAWHHDAGKILGRVHSLSEDSYGVKMVGVIHKQAEGSPLRYLYDTIRRGSGKVGLSVGGYFSRANTATGRMIDRVLRITEISATSRPSHPLTMATAVETKAIMGGAPTLADVERELAMLSLRASVHEIRRERARSQTAAERLSNSLL